MQKTVIIMGAAGRDFHNFNTLYRHHPEIRVGAFTATQIHGIDNRLYPAALAGPQYPQGIPIYPERRLESLIHELEADTVLFAYSDVSHKHVMQCASRVQAAGASFLLAGTTETMLKSRRPVIGVCAVRTGCGKSQTTRAICNHLTGQGLSVAVVRHPMPYGDLNRQAVQHFQQYKDFERYDCTIEEREEYEPLVAMGIAVWAGVDYQAILKAAEKEADIIIWDGGNNDTPFFKPDIHITLLDPHRAGHELTYYPGQTNLLMADIAIIAKTDTASAAEIETIENNITTHAPNAIVITAESPITMDSPDSIRGKRVLIIEDGPTVTHGGMTFGAGSIAARNAGAREFVDPRPFAKGSLQDVFRTYPAIGPILPAMGYGKQQLADLEATIEACECDVVVSGTPADISRLLTTSKPIVQAQYAYADTGRPSLFQSIDILLQDRCPMSL